MVGPPRRGAHRPRLPARHPRLPVRGARARRQGASGAGDPPAPPGRAAARGARAGRARRRGRGQSRAAAVPAVAARLARHRRRPAAVHARPGGARAGGHRRRGAPPRPRRARRGDARARRRRPAPGPHPHEHRAGARPARPAARRLRRPARRRPVGAGGCARRPGAGERPPRDRHRARPHRHRVAVAAAGDRAQVHPHVRLGGRPDGLRARVPVLVLAGAAVRLDRRARARAVRPHHRQGRRRSVGPGRRHVGRARHEPAVRREHRPPDRPRAALLRGALRDAVPGGVDPRRVRLPGRPAPGVRGRRDASVRHPEAVVEPHQPVPSLHVLLGGHRRHPRAHPLPAGRHVQRRGHAGGAGPGDGELRRARVERLVAAALRVRRRWRRSDAGDARAGPAPRRPGRHAPGRVGHGRRLLRPRRRRSRPRRAGAGVARRALLREPPRHPHQPVAHQARQQALRAAAPRARALDGDTGQRRSVRVGCAVAGGAHAAVPRHPARLVDRLGPRRRRGRPRPHRRRTGGARRRRAGLPRASGAGARQQRHPRS